MGLLILDTQGTEVYREGLRIRLEIPSGGEENILRYVPVIKIQRVFVYGYVQITNQALMLFLNEGIPVCFFSLNGRLLVEIQP